MIKEGTIPNMMLYGKAGTGKTTVARALANDIGADSIIINCSEEIGRAHV
jgi:replication-associated recombination protein RarA